MNRLLKYRALVAVILVTNLLGIVACASAQRTTYVTLGTTANVVEAARKGYDDLYQAGKITPEFDAQVLVAYTKYQQSMNAALSAFKAYKIVADAGGVVDPTVVNNMIVEASKAIADLFALFNIAGVPTGSVTIEQVK